MRPTRVHNFGTYFVTVETWGRRQLFRTAWLAQLLLQTLYDYRAQSKYLLHEFVIMPEHLHLILTPQQTLERAMQLIKGGFSYRAGKQAPGMEIWQKGITDHRIRDSDGSFVDDCHFEFLP